VYSDNATYLCAFFGTITVYVYLINARILYHTKSIKGFYVSATPQLEPSPCWVWYRVTGWLVPKVVGPKYGHYSICRRSATLHTDGGNKRHKIDLQPINFKLSLLQVNTEHFYLD
jgi:hypothetical protein